MPFNESFTKSQGIEIGKILIQHYEKNKAIDKWNASTFVEYLQEASAILEQDSNWEVIGENIIHGRISACPMARVNGEVDIASCVFIEGLFEGWISHAFNERADRIYREQTQINNKFCEIYAVV
jgi:predicted hydrocarbon binding protein